MPVPAIFTSSAGGDIGGAGAPHKTRFKGPLRIGTLTTAPATLVDPHGSTGGTGGGTPVAPLYAFALRPDCGNYLVGVTSSAPEIRTALAGIDYIGYSTTRMAILSTDVTGVWPPLVWAQGLMASSANTGCIYLPQTTYAVSSSSGTSSGVTPPALGTGVAMLFDSLRNKISVFSTVANQWLSVTLTSS